ncbi:MAG: SIMPL domain-containing protein [Chlorobi bacterium]|nr:SIMPL domain-containing protein [Chlorobiota bacterium]
MKSYSSSVIFGIAIVTASFFLGKAYVDRNKPVGTIQVTGLGKADFTSDLIVWEGNFESKAFDLQEAYVILEREKKTIKDYLYEKGVNKTDIVFSAVETQSQLKPRYSFEGKYIGEEFDGYLLTQSVTIQSKDVKKVENISREITELLNKGVQLYSQPPRYYYTKLADLKIEMISKATKDARVRAEKIAEFSGGKLGKLVSARMGVFQITGQYSKEDYSWGGTFNTSSKEKTASITMKLVYKVD